MATLPSVFSEGGQRGWLRHFSEGTDELIQNETSYEPDAMLRCVCPGDFWRFGISGNCCQGKHETPYSVLVSNMVSSGIMDTARKITVEVPVALLEKAQQASGAGVTQTVRTGLQLVAASRTYARLRKLRGKVRFSRSLTELKADR